jgi:small-conductance mechanosensitive channel
MLGMFSWVDSFPAWEPWIRWLISAAYVAFFIGIAFLARFIFTRVFTIITRRTPSKLDDYLLDALVQPVFIAFIVLGLWLAVSRATEVADYTDWVTKSFIAIYILVAALAVTRVIDALLNWYGREIAVRTSSKTDDVIIPILRRSNGIIVFGIAIIIVLGQFGVEISPLLAALGIGGLAVSLALQPTLSNFMAGTYIMSDTVTHPGDFMELDNGIKGFVEKVNWRTTRIRSWDGNIITIPNSKLAESIVTNYEEPARAMLFLVKCGVSYASDLDKVERVTLEVARDVMQRLPEGAKDAEPAVQFNEFGDSNVVFNVVLKSADRPGYFVVRHEFIKALHKRYRQEGIEIQYPVRKLYFAENGAARGAGTGMSPLAENAVDKTSPAKPQSGKRPDHGA